MERWRWVGVWCFAAAGVGCHSGPDTIVDYCRKPPASASDQHAARVLAGAVGHHDLDGTWLGGSQAAVLEIDMDVGARLPSSGTECGDALMLAASVNVRTRDGVVSGQGTVIQFYDGDSATAEIPLPGLADAYAHPDPALPPLTSADENQSGIALASTPAPTLVLTMTEDSSTANVVVDQRRVVGRWSSNVSEIPARRSPTYVVPSELVSECAPAADFTGAHGQYTPFASGADATAATIGTWIRCRSYGGPEHDGIQILPDGSWQMLAWQDGGFVTRGGIQREGALEPPIDLSNVNGTGFFQVNLRGPAVWRPSFVWDNRLLLSDTTAPPDFGESVYVRTDRSVVSAPNPYTTGQRAGAAACEVAESGTIDPDLGGPMETILAGTWTLCSGELLEGYAGLTFDGNGAVTFLDVNGQSMGGLSYRALHPETVPALSPRETNLLLPDGRDWEIIFSQRPLKMWLLETGQPTVVHQAVFSPLP